MTELYIQIHEFLKDLEIRGKRIASENIETILECLTIDYKIIPKRRDRELYYSRKQASAICLIFDKQLSPLEYKVRYQDDIIKNNSPEIEKLGRKGGYIAFLKQVGIHAMTKEERKKLGKKNGYRSYINNQGIHGMSEEEKEKARKKCIENRGQVPWVKASQGKPSEIKLAYKLSQQDNYKLQRGPRKGSSNMNAIADVINQEFHNGKPVRNNRSLTLALLRYKALFK